MPAAATYSYYFPHLVSALLHSRLHILLALVDLGAQGDSLEVQRSVEGGEGQAAVGGVCWYGQVHSTLARQGAVRSPTLAHRRLPPRTSL